MAVWLQPRPFNIHFDPLFSFMQYVGPSHAVDGMTHYTFRMPFFLFAVSCGAGDLDRRACLFIYMTHGSVGGSSQFSLTSCVRYGIPLALYYITIISLTSSCVRSANACFIVSRMCITCSVAHVLTAICLSVSNRAASVTPSRR